MIKPGADLRICSGLFVLFGVCMKNKKITKKDKLKACDLLAFADGCERRRPEDLERVEAMQDNDIKDLLYKDIAAAVEEIKPGEVPADLVGVCDNIINEFCSRFAIDKYKMSPLQWGACCSYVGRWFDSRLTFRCLHEKSAVCGNFEKINVEALAELVPVWAMYCGIYNKVPLLNDFCEFAGVSYKWLWKLESGDGVTPAEIDLYKKVHAICRAGLDRRLLDGKQPPIGAIFYAKSVEGYQETQTIRHEYTKTIKTAADLPIFDDAGRLIPKKGENI